MARYHHPLSGHEFEQTLGDSEGQRILVCAVHGVTESDTTWQPNNNKKKNYRPISLMNIDAYIYMCVCVYMSVHTDTAICKKNYIL